MAKFVLPQALGKRRRNVGLFAVRDLDSENQHVLGHPAFVPGDVGGDAEGEAFFAKQGVAAVTGAIAPDFARLGEVTMYLSALHGHETSF